MASEGPKSSIASVNPVSPLAIGLTCAALLGLQASILIGMGQPLTCTCGTVRFWTSDVSGGENSQQLADWYSLSHLLHGLIFYGLLKLAAPRAPFGWRLAIAIGLEAGWELLENSPLIIERFRQTAIAQGYFGDTVLNSVGDNLSAAAGFFLARRLPVLASVGVFVIIEIVLLLAIKDNLTVMIINLIWPGAIAL